MKSVSTLLGTALSAAALITLVALPQQNAGAKAPQNAQPKPAAKPPEQAKPAPQQSAPKPGDAKPADPKAGADAKPADSNAQNADKAKETEAALTARYEKLATIGEEHKWMGNFVGKWKTTTKVMLKPNTPIIESTGTSEFKLLMDGRFLVESNASTNAQGNSQGMGVIGFNNVTKKYERVWFDTRSTAMVKSEGDYAKDRDEIRWSDQWTDPGAAQIITTNSTLHRLNEKQFIFTQSITLPNNEAFIALVVQYQKAE
jgi:hypothetical protein